MLRLSSLVGLALLLLGASSPTYNFIDDDGSAPPRDLSPTYETLAQLRTARATLLDKPRPTSLVEDWTTTESHLQGTEHDVERGKDFRIDAQLGALHSADGSLAGTLWHQNNNGEVTIQSGLHHGETADALAVENLPAASSTLLGESDAPAPAYVVRVHPAGGHLQYVFVDKTSLLVTRVERASSGSRIATIYDDFRTTDGYTQAWHVHAINVRTGDEDDRQLQSISVNAAVPDTALAIPKNASPVRLVPNGEPLPAKILSDRVIVTVRMKGRAVNLQLDSGASTILIDTGVLAALNIPTYGHATGSMAGDYALTYATIPEMTFGNVTMHDTVVASVPFTTFADERTPVAGLLGFDFIDSVVLHVDYQHGTLTALDPATFVPPTGAFALDILLDDNVPVVPATIGTALGSHFMLDTGADTSALYNAFVKAHPSDVVDQGLGTQMRDAYPFETAFLGVGGRVSYRPMQVGPFHFAGQTFAQWIFYATYNAQTFEGNDYDGLIGQDVLRYFDVYLDYQHAKIYFLPNQRFRDRWG